MERESDILLSAFFQRPGLDFPRDRIHLLYEAAIRQFEKEIQMPSVQHIGHLQQYSASQLEALEVYCRIRGIRNELTMKTHVVSYILESMGDSFDLYYLREPKSITDVFFRMTCESLRTILLFVRGHFEFRKLKRTVE